MSVLHPISEQQSMKCLVEAIQEMSLARNLESVMRIVRTAARKLTGADGATFVLRDGDKCYYAEEDAIAPLWKGQRFPMEICISGWSMLNRRPAVIPDIYQDSRIPIDAYRPTFVKSLVMVPVRSIDPIAAIGNYWASEHDPSEEEIGLLQSLADVTAVTMENVQVYAELEMRIRERTQQLLESLDREREMNKVKTRMVSMASHEFKTPLSAILTSTYLLEQYDATNCDAEKKGRHLEKIRNNVSNLNDILHHFLEADKLEQGKTETNREKIDIANLVQELMDELAGTWRMGQKVNVTQEGAASIVQDRKVLKHILINLLSNASKYSGEHQPIDFHIRATGNETVISVKDHGIGIPKEDQHRIFSEFFRAGNVNDIPGTGIGLSIVKRYVDMLNGEIRIQSEPGKGTCFTLVLSSDKLIEEHS